MIVWLSLIATAALLAFVLFTPRREPQPKAKARRPREAKPRGGRSQLIVSESSGIPKLMDEEEDLEVTLITASPASGAGSGKIAAATVVPKKRPKLDSQLTDDGSSPPVSATVSTSVDTPPDEDPSSEGCDQNPKVEVIYEEEAEVEEITAPVARILLTAHGDSDVGKRRPRNEDSLLIFPERSVFVVADGMGGYDGGQVASALAVETIRSAFENNHFVGKTESETNVPRRGRELSCAIQMANYAIFSKARQTPELSQMGTTVISARFSPNKQRVYIGHVGDSRCYRLRNGKLRQLTTDHTMRQLGMKGRQANALFRALGVEPQVTIDLVVDKPRNNDLYLLCSDGLSKMVSDDRVCEILMGEQDLEAAVYGLIEAANDQGGRDNITAIIIKVIDRMPYVANGSASEDSAEPSQSQAS